MTFTFTLEVLRTTFLEGSVYGKLHARTFVSMWSEILGFDN